MADIELSNLTKRYPDGTLAVDGINLHVPDGEFMVLIGPSGCGKTTALRMLAGLEDISDGTIRVGDRVVNQVPPKRRDIAMVFQSYALYPHMTVRQNIEFALKLAGLPKKLRTQRVEDTASMLELGNHLERRPANLSGGQRQRVAIGRAIVRQPQAFLMDEPLSNLDAKLRVQMRLELARLQKQLGTTTVYVTHDQVEAMTLGDRLAVMRGGVIQQIGTPTALYQRPGNVFVAGFIGSPPMNLLPAQLHEDTISLPFGDAPLPAQLRRKLTTPARRGAVIAGIRPEAFDDPALAGDQTANCLRFRARVDLVEAMGPEVLAYFPVDAPRPPGIAGDDPDPAVPNSSTAVARLDATSTICAGAETDLLVRTNQISVFDATTGANLTLP